MTQAFWPEQLERWSCHQLGWGGLWQKQVWGDEQKASFGHVEC